MATPGYYDIPTQRNSTFQFHVEYQDENGNGVNLTGYTARFHVRPNPDSATKYLEITVSGVTSGGSTGSWTGTAGVSGSGGISLNKGETGAALTGGVLITVDSTTMGYIPYGKWWYSLDITKGTTTDEILFGRFDVQPKGTR
jgi:hypothetical protein